MNLSFDQKVYLIQRAKQGDEDAFNKLWEAYEKAVEGFIRPRLWPEQVADPDVAHDIAQDAWVLVKKKISIYDFAKGDFYTFVVYWAKIMLVRYFKEAGRRNEIEVLMYEFPELEGDGEVQEIVKEIQDPSTQNTTTEFRTYEVLLKVTFREGGYPHQLIAFGFNKLVDGWKPQKIVGKFSDISLKPLGKNLEEDYISESRLPEDYIRECFQPLRDKMNKNVCEVITDTASREFLQKILAELVGETILRDYYGEEPADSISDWTYKVKRRVIRYIAKSRSLDFLF